MVIGSGSTNNLVSTEMVENLKLKKTKHPVPYKVYWLHKGHQILVSEQCEVDFQIGPYKDKILCDVMPMDVCHMLLGRLWKFDKKVTHDGRSNCHSFEQNGRTHVLHPLQVGSTTCQSEPKVLMLSRKEYLQQVEKADLNYVVVCKPRVVVVKTNVTDLP